MPRSLVHRYAGPRGLALALRWRRTVDWARTAEGGRKTTQDPYERIIDALVREWAGRYRVWDVFTAPGKGERAHTLELCHAWRLVRGEGLAWRLEVREFSSGQWQPAAPGACGFPDFQAWPFHRISEPARAKALRLAVIALLVRQARAQVICRLGLAPDRKLGAWNGEMARRIRERHWGRPGKGLLRNNRLEAAMRVFTAALWQQAMDKRIASGLACVYGFSGYRMSQLTPHLVRPERLFAWEARPHLRPLLSKLAVDFWPEPDQCQILVADCVDEAHRQAVLEAKATLLGTAVRESQCGLAYWGMGERARRKLDDLPMRDRQALVQWCAKSQAQHMPLALMESLVLAHRHHLLRAMDAGLPASHTGAQALERLGPLAAAGRRLSTPRRGGRAVPVGVIFLGPTELRWPGADRWERVLGMDHPWGAVARQRRLEARVPKEQCGARKPARAARL